MPADTAKRSLFGAHQIMETSSSAVASGVGGLLRDGWSGISEALSTSTTNIQSPAAPITPTAHATPANSGELLELTSRLTRQLKRAEETCRRIEIRERNRIELLKRCLIACCAKESAEVLELALELSENEEPDVEKASKEFKELLIVRASPDEKIEMELNRVAELEKQLKEERAARLKADEEKAVVLSRLKTQEEAFKTEREKYYMERISVEDTVKERLYVETLSYHARIQAMEQTHKDKLALETTKLNDKIKALEVKLEKETSANKKRQEVRTNQEAEMLHIATAQKDAEIERLRALVIELEDASKPQRDLMSFAKVQSSKERVMMSLEHRVKELENRLAFKEQELFEIVTLQKGAVPPEILGPARGDYLRHIILRYMTFESLVQKQSLIPVIAMLLNFTPDEKKLCESCAARDIAKEGLLGTLNSTFQAMPIRTFFGSSTDSSSQARPVASSARYIPVATTQTGSNGNTD